MKIKPKMVEVALDRYQNTPGWRDSIPAFQLELLRADMCAALEAALAEPCSDWLGSFLKSKFRDAERDALRQGAQTPDRVEVTRLEFEHFADVDQGKPDPALLISMAIRLRHDFGLLSEKERAALIDEMGKVWEEVAGQGFYSPANRERYLRIADRDGVREHTP